MIKYGKFYWSTITGEIDYSISYNCMIECGKGKQNFIYKDMEISYGDFMQGVMKIRHPKGYRFSYDQATETSTLYVNVESDEQAIKIWKEIGIDRV